MISLASLWNSLHAIEVNFSCPHGMPERRMGAAVGQDCALLEEVCGWVNAKATVPVWAKMTPNITDITQVSFLYCSFIALHITIYHLVLTSNHYVR